MTDNYSSTSYCSRRIIINKRTVAINGKVTTEDEITFLSAVTKAGSVQLSPAPHFGSFKSIERRCETVKDFSEKIGLLWNY